MGSTTTRRKPATARVQPWRLQEAPFPVRFLTRIDDGETGWRIDEDFVPRDVVRASFLDQALRAYQRGGVWRVDEAGRWVGKGIDAYDSQRDLSLMDLAHVLYGEDYLERLGWPLAIDPTRRRLLLGRPDGDMRDESRKDLRDNFHALPLGQRDEDGRLAVLTFCRRYGWPFVPFLGLSAALEGADGGSPATCPDYSITMGGSRPHSLACGWENLRPQTEEGDPWRRQWPVSGRAFCFFEAFDGWRLATFNALRMPADRPTMEGTQLLGILWQRCVVTTAEFEARLPAVHSGARFVYPLGHILAPAMDCHKRRYAAATGEEGKVTCMAPGCRKLTKRDSKRGAKAERLGERWAFCRAHQSGAGEKKWRAILSSHLDVPWAREERDAMRRRKTVQMRRIREQARDSNVSGG